MCQFDLHIGRKQESFVEDTDQEVFEIKVKPETILGQFLAAILIFFSLLFLSSFLFLSFLLQFL